MTRRALTAAIAALAATAAATVIGAETSRLIETEAARRAESALAAAGQSWARLSADGLTLTISGEAPKDEARAAALAAISWRWASVQDRATTAPPPPAAPPPATRIEILRGLTEVTVLGALAGEASRRMLISAIKAPDPDVSIIDLSRDGAQPVDGGPAAWRAAGDVAATLLHGRIVVTAGSLKASGVLKSEAADAGAGAVAALRAEGWEVALELAAARPASAPFALRARRRPGEGALTACAAPTKEAAKRIRDRADEVFGDAGVACRFGDGAPDDDWTEAALASLDALAAIPAGDISLIERRARLVAAPPSRALAAATARKALAARLPAGYQVAVLRSDDAVPPGAHGRKETETVGALTLSWDAGVMRIMGPAPSAVLAEAVGAFAHGAAPGAKIVNELRVGAGGTTPVWRGAAMALVAALARSESGRAVAGDDGVLLVARVANAALIAPLHQVLANGVGPDVKVKTRLTVSPAAIAAAQPSTPARCAERLSEIVALTPVRFAPGSAELDPAGAPVIERLARTLAPCAGGRIEIGGHTDSQGSETTNLNLSRARAEAVLSGLVAAGARLSLLTAKGYGEANPIADNASDEGRARNRRIEFTVAPGKGASE